VLQSFLMKLKGVVSVTRTSATSLATISAGIVANLEVSSDRLHDTMTSHLQYTVQKPSFDAT
jgi:hypothetical protein